MNPMTRLEPAATRGFYPEESDDYGQTDASENQTHRSANQPYDGAGQPLNSGLTWRDGGLPFWPVPGRPSGCTPKSDYELHRLPDDETARDCDESAIRNGCRAGEAANKGPYGCGDSHQSHEPPVYPPRTDVPVASYKGA